MGELDQYTHEYHQQLLADSEGLKALDSKFGVTTSGVVEFQVGRVNEPLVDYHKPLEGTFILPYRSATGHTMALRFNSFEFDFLKEYDGGYFERDYPLEVPELHLFNVGHALPGLRTNEVMLVEDTLSVIRLRQEGYRAVAAPGFENFYEPWFELFREAKVTVVFNDDSIESGQRLIQTMRKKGIRHTGLALPSDQTIWSMLSDGQTTKLLMSQYRVTFGVIDDSF